MKNDTKQLIIIGSGPAGLTAAIYASRSNLHPILVEGSKPGGQLMNTTAVENWPGDISIMGPKLMMNMKEHAQHFGTTFVSGDVVKIDLAQRPFSLVTSKEQELKTHSLIVATGAMPKRLNITGEETYWGKGVTTCAVCDGAFHADKPVIIVGGGDTAMENASFMTKFTDKITIVHILDELTASAAMQKRVLDNPKIKIIYNSTVTEINGTDAGVTSATITNQKTNETTKLDANAVFIAIGYSPNTSIFKGQLDMDKWGYLTVKNHTHTSIEGVFAAGDVADYRYRQAITSAGSGCMAALDAERWLSKTGK